MGVVTGVGGLGRMLAVVLLAGGAAGALAGDTDDGRAPLKGTQGFLILPIETDAAIPKMKFEARDAGSFELIKLPAGRHVLFVRAKAGDYNLMRVTLGGNWFIEIDHPNKSPVSIEVVAGAITYAGDLTMDRQGGATAFRLGGCSIDMLRLLARAVDTLDDTVLDRYEVVDRAKECKPLDPPDGDRRKVDAWAEAAKVPGTAHDLATLGRWLTTLGGKPLEVGQAASAAWDSLEKLPTDKVNRFRDSEEGSAAIWVRPSGRWGWKGLRAIYYVGLEGDKVAGASLREFETNGTFRHASVDTRQDVEADIDAASQAHAASVKP